MKQQRRRSKRKKSPPGVRESLFRDWNRECDLFSSRIQFANQRESILRYGMTFILEGILYEVTYQQESGILRLTEPDNYDFGKVIMLWNTVMKDGIPVICLESLQEQLDAITVGEVLDT